MKNARYVLAALVIVLIMVYSLLIWQKKDSYQPTENNNNDKVNNQSALSLNIKKVANEAFGALTYQAVSGDQNMAESNGQRNDMAVTMPSTTNAGGSFDGKMIPSRALEWNFVDRERFD